MSTMRMHAVVKSGAGVTILSVGALLMIIHFTFAHPCPPL